ncbi:putative serine/threonine protein kinase [Nymphaea thermarum]|nr:putative serine/threonine protein kinase [Nymphaea thermarum]
MCLVSNWRSRSWLNYQATHMLWTRKQSLRRRIMCIWSWSVFEGGEHYQLLEDHKLLSEAEAVVMFMELMEVLKYCHDKGVMHRELKPENILLATNSKSSPIKLADFGLASYIRPEQALYGIVGSPYYIATKVLAGGYNEAADWATSFLWGTTALNFDEVRAAEIWFPAKPWDCVSASAKDLIRRMLCRDPKHRLTAAQALDHCWFKNEEKLLGDEGQFGSLEDSLPEQLIPMNCDFVVNSSNVVCSDVQRHLSPYVYLQNVIFFLLAGATGCSPSTGLLFRSSASSDEECSTPIASMPSFAFFAPCTPESRRTGELNCHRRMQQLGGHLALGIPCECSMNLP